MSKVVKKVSYDDLYSVVHKILTFDNPMLGWLLNDLKIYEFLRKLPDQLYMDMFVQQVYEKMQLDQDFKKKILGENAS
jgi:hypothetical protein